MIHSTWFTVHQTEISYFPHQNSNFENWVAFFQNHTCLKLSFQNIDLDHTGPRCPETYGFGPHRTENLIFLKASLNLSWFDDFAQNFAILEPDILLVLKADTLGVNDTKIINISMMNPENLIFILLEEDLKSC